MLSQVVTIFYIPPIKVQGSNFSMSSPNTFWFFSLLFLILAILVGVKHVSLWVWWLVVLVAFCRLLV